MTEPIKILLIDDDENLFIIYRRLLDNAFHNKITIENALTLNEATQKIKEKHYDIIILDQKLDNGHKGTDLLPKIKKENIYSHIIINSAYGSETLATEAIRNGADNYIQGNKENNEELLEVIRKTISQVEKQQSIKKLSETLKEFNLETEKTLMDEIEKIKEKYKHLTQ